MEMKVEEIERRVGLLLYEYAGKAIAGEWFLRTLMKANIARDCSVRVNRKLHYTRVLCSFGVYCTNSWFLGNGKGTVISQQAIIERIVEFVCKHQWKKTTNVYHLWLYCIVWYNFKIHLHFKLLFICYICPQIYWCYKIHFYIFITL